MLPVWPVVLLAGVLWSAAGCSGASGVPQNNVPVVVTGADWLGRSREDVLVALGQPLSALRRGDTEVLMYTGDVRIEIRDDAVVTYRVGNGPAIIARDGTRYAATDRGKIKRMVPPPVETIAVDEPAAVAAATAAPAVRVLAPAAATIVPAPPRPEVDDELGDSTGDDPAETWMHPPELADGSQHPMAQATQDLAERGLLPMSGPKKEAAPWVRPVREIIGALLRFGFGLLIIRIAISWAELPCYLPDVVKVAALFVIIREGVHGLINLGGQWEWIRLFMIDDIVAYIALMILLLKFKVALSGLTAVKIASATISVTYFLMLMVAVVLSFIIG